MVQDKYFLSGQSNIMNLPEFQNIDKVKEFVNAIENQEILKAISVAEDGLTVRIGAENFIKAMKDCTVITVPYEIANGERGAIAVIGPTRMDYQKIIPLLEYIAKNIKRVM
jgi:heat-inducible transcriptional repressor